MTETTRRKTKYTSGSDRRVFLQSHLRMKTFAGICLLVVLLTLAGCACGASALGASSGPGYVFSEVGMVNITPYQEGYHVPVTTAYIIVPFNITLDTNQIARGYFIQENSSGTSAELHGKIQDIELAYASMSSGSATKSDNSKVAAASATADQFSGASSLAFLEKLNTANLVPGTYDVGFTINTAWSDTATESTSITDWQDGVFSVSFQFIVEGMKEICFMPNGATAGTMPNQSVAFDATVNLNKNTYTRAGYDFLQWATQSDGNGTIYLDEAPIHLYDNITLYAQWVELGKHSIYGTIANATGYQVNLTLNGTDGSSRSYIVPAGQTSYYLDEIPVGVYDLKAEYTDDDGYTYSVVYLIEIVKEDDSVLCDIAFPTKRIASIVDVSTRGNTPNVAVGGLTDESLSHADEVLDTQYAELAFVAEAHPAAEIPTDSSLILQKIRETHPDAATSDVFYLNSTVSFTIFDASSHSVISQSLIHETNNVLEICIPYDFVNKKAIYVYRSHDGNATLLNALSEKPSKPFVDGTYYLDTTNALVRVYADKYSIYSIAYVASASPTSGGGGSSHQSGYSIVLPGNPTVTPTATPSYGDNQTPLPTSSGGYRPQTSASPVPVAGLIAGFGVVSLLIALRRK